MFGASGVAAAALIAYAISGMVCLSSAQQQSKQIVVTSGYELHASLTSQQITRIFLTSNVRKPAANSADTTSSNYARTPDYSVNMLRVSDQWQLVGDGTLTACSSTTAAAGRCPSFHVSHAMDRQLHSSISLS